MAILLQGIRAVRIWGRDVLREAIWGRDVLRGAVVRAAIGGQRPVTGQERLPETLADWPTHAPSPAMLGHVELLLAGVYGPSTRVTLDVPAQLSDEAARTRHLVLIDEEGTPLADVAVETVSLEDGGSSARLVGPASALRPFSSGPFRGLRRRPDEVRNELAGTPAIALALDRPLMRTEEQTLTRYAAGRGARLLLLPLVADVGWTGLPPEVLVRAIRASLPRLTTPTGPALLVPLPLVPDADRDFVSGATAFARATGAYFVDALVSPHGGEWSSIASALEAGTGVLEKTYSPAVAAILRDWRPGRVERGLTIFFTGLSGSGKSTLARGVADAVLERGRKVTMVDGDVARQLLSSDLGFNAADRDLNVRRIGWVAAEVTRHGGVAVCAPIAPFGRTRREVRRMVERNGGFVLVHVATPLEVCEERDRKGLYAKARAGLIPDFTGISSAYEVPDDADIRVDTSSTPVDEAVAAIIGRLEQEGWLGKPAP